jgi:apolipoprotein N-acyltransferase
MKIFRRKTLTTPEERKQGRKELLLGIISGIMMGLSFPPFPFPYLSFIAFIPFLYVIEKRESLASLNRFTYFTIFIFNLITLYWVGSWTKETDKFLMISGITLLFFNPLFYLIVTSLYHFSKRSFNKKIALYLFPLYWVSFEYLYSLTDLRFPWLTLGNCLPYFQKFIQIADIIGVYGLSLIILYINIFIYLAVNDFKEVKKIKYNFVITAAVIFIAVMLYGIIRINTFRSDEDKIKVGLVQPNINPWTKWEVGNLDAQLDLYLNLSEKAAEGGAKLIIWPESALPVYLLSGNNEPQVTRIRNFVTAHNVFLMTGMPDVNIYFNKNEAPAEAKKTRIGALYTSYNSVLLFSPYTLDVQKYKKVMLVPFGEHVPFVEDLPFLGDFIKWEVGISSWNVGKDKTVLELTNNANTSIKAAGVICIESIYPDFIAGFVQKGANLLVVVTNDSWYGYSSGPFQHKVIAVLRAVENRKTVVRAANGGISCIIYPLGDTISETKFFTRDVLLGEAGIQSGITFYSKYPLIIPLFVSLISILTIIIFTFKKISIKLKKKL